MVLSTLRNFVRSLCVLIAVTFGTFSLMYGNATGIARSILGLGAGEQDVLRKVAELGLDRPLVVQYWDWMTSALRGDLGRSFYTNEAVTSALGNRVPVTLSIVLITLALTAVLSVALGVTAAVRGGWTDRVVQFFSILGNAIPAYIVAIVLVLTFAVAWRLLPATGYVAPDVDAGRWLQSITLPVVALLIGSIASAAQQFRTATLDVMGRDFVRTLRARGVSEREVIFRNVLRNAAAPGLTVLSLQLFSLLGGAVFIEQVFALPGIGHLANFSAQSGDVPMVMGAVLVGILIVLTVNFVGDLAINLLNPKARKR